MNPQNYFYFLKVNNDLQVLKGASYEITNFEGKQLKGNITIDNDGVYKFTLDSAYYSSFENTLGVLPSVVSNYINSISSVDKLNNNEWYYYESWYSNQYIVPVNIIETKSPVGYKKSNLQTFFEVGVSYKVEDNSITDRAISITLNDRLPIVREGTYSFDYNDLNSFLINNVNNTFLRDPDEMSSCNGQVALASSFSASYCDRFAHYFMDEEGTVTLKIDNTVNGVVKYDASLTKKLQYSIKVKNAGNAASGDNIIVTYAPKEVVVDESSISDGGVYNSDDHSITWNVEYLDPNQAIELRYNAEAPKNVKEQNLTGYSTVSSGQSPRVRSNETVVTMKDTIALVENPNTGVNGLYIPKLDLFIPGYFILIIMMIIVITVIIKTKKVKKISNSN